MIQIKSFTFNLLGTNCFVVWDDAQHGCIVCDPGMYRDFEVAALEDFISAEGLVPEAILLTHGHFDHVWSAAATARRYGCGVYMSAADRDIARLGMDLFERLDFKKKVELFDFTPVEDGQILHLGGIDWKVISTPGHSPGGVCYYSESGKLLLSGDTLLAGAIGRSDLPGGDYDILMKSLLEKVLALPGEVDVYPGHGGATSIAREAATNPFLIPYNEDSGDSWADSGGISLQRD